MKKDDRSKVEYIDRGEAENPKVEREVKLRKAKTRKVMRFLDRLFGFMLATVSVQGVFKSYAVISFAVPLLILGLPLFDAAFAMLRRILTGKSPMVADRGHLHHRLIDMGFSQKQTVFILYAISGVLGITAVLLAESGTLRALILLMCVLILILIGQILTKPVPGSDDKTGENKNE